MNKREVTLDVINNCPATISAQWDFGDGSPVSTFSVASGAMQSTTHWYLPGNYTAVLLIPGCAAKSVAITVPICCPTIAFNVSVGDCNADGKRSVSYGAVLTAGSPLTAISATMAGPCGAVSGSQSGSLALTDSCALNAGTHTVTVTATGCPTETFTFTVDDCCPKVDFNVVVKGWPICTAQGTRPVTITATVTPPNGVQTSATMIDTASGAVLASGTGSSPFTLTGVGNYPGGTHQVEVSFGAPLNCPPQPFQFCVPKCETLTCFNLRSLVVVVALATFLTITLLNAIAALAAALDASTSGTLWFLFGRYLDYQGDAALQSALGVVQAVALALAIGSFVWWALCIKVFKVQVGACCFTWCTLYLILWQVAIVVGIALLYFLAVSWLLNLIVAVVLFIVAFLLLQWWKAKCCPGKCDAKFYIAVALALAVGQAVGVIDSFAHLSAACVQAPNAISVYLPLYISVLEIVTNILRILIWVALATSWVAFGSCAFSDPD